MNMITAYELAKICVNEIIIYLRKSRAERNETVEEVLARHEKILQDFAIQTFGQKIPEENIYREVVSGETLDERIEIKKVFNRLEKENIKGLLVVEPQRISRGDMLDCGRVVRILKYTETLCVTITKTYDINNKFDKELFEAQLLQGNKYLEYTKELFDRGKALSIREGKYIGSTPPFGYDRKALDKGFMLIKHKEESITVETIFKLFVDENLTTVEIASYLNKHRMKPRKNTLWDDGMVRNVLKNEVYYGSLAWGKRPIVKKLIDGELTKFRISNDEYMLVRGLHEAIVSKDKWDIAQEKIRNHRSARNGTSRELKNPLAGLVFCEKCGYSLVRVKNRRRAEKRKKVRKYELDKPAINQLLRNAKERKGVSYKEIADFLGVSKHSVVAWFDLRIDHVYYSEIFSEKWYELKFLLEIDTDEYDEQILTYVDPEPLNDTFMCSNQNCDMVSCCLQKLEKAILDDLKISLKKYKYYVKNYETEIIKERADNQKTIIKINKEIDGLKQELKNIRRAYSKEEFTYEEYLEDKKDIELELEGLQLQLNEFENDDEADTLLRYKKAIPKLQMCLKEYDKMTIPQKNETLKSIIERITYYKTKRLNWRKKEEDDMVICIDMIL
jgi:transcriptional regulator with XRE-family HTH domain